MFEAFPCDLSIISTDDKKQLFALSDQLDTLMKKNVSFKLNAGKRIGNYNLAKCRNVTDQSDFIFAKYFGFSNCWESVEQMYRQIVKTNFE